MLTNYTTRGMVWVMKDWIDWVLLIIVVVAFIAFTEWIFSVVGGY